MGADLREADLRGARFFQTSLHKADLSGADLAFAQLSTNLCQANFTHALMPYVDLQHSDLRGATLCKAALSHAILRGTDCTGADFYRAGLSMADLFEANFKSAKLRDAYLDETKFRHTDLTRTDFSQAVCDGTIFSDVDLSSALGLETVLHSFPSTIGVDTIYKSRGQIPEGFLRGAGVPDALIASIPALIGALEPIQFYSCFISHSHKDEEFCKRLHSKMRDNHLRVWFAPEDMKGGQKVYEQIDQAIRVHDKLLLVLSETSMKSDWVATEIYKARQREVKEGKRVLFPIRLVPFEKIRDWECFDADTGNDMAREVREYFIPDFSNWKDHDLFEAGFARLLTDLKAVST